MEQSKKFKSGKSRRETAVQGTNDCSIVSKCSMAGEGYFNDAFLQEFVSKTAKRSPLINRGYYIRATAIDYILRKFLAFGAAKKQILSLGAGFDSAYFRLQSEGVLGNVIFCEIDFCDVVKRKHTVISSNTKLIDLIPGYTTQGKKEDPLIEINTAGYKLLGVDLTQHNTLEALLKLCGIDFDIPTLLLSECVLTYMTKRCSSNVIHWAAETFTNSTFVLYEQIHPNDAFGLFMQNHFKTIGSALKCINAFPTMESQLQRFKKLGWERYEAMDMNQFYNNLVSNDERIRVEHLEPFDEYEEWHLKCAHYMILCAYNGACPSLLTDIAKVDNPFPVKFVQSCVTIQHVPDVNNIMRIGHSSAIAEDYIVTIAGFGEECGKHQRLSSVTVTDVRTGRSRLLQFDVDLKKTEVGRLRHTLCSLNDGRIIMIGGRTSPIYTCVQVISLNLKRNSENSNAETNSNCGASDKLTSDKNRTSNEVKDTSCEGMRSSNLNPTSRNSNNLKEEKLNSNSESRNLVENSNLFNGVKDSRHSANYKTETNNHSSEFKNMNSDLNELKIESSNLNSESNSENIPNKNSNDIESKSNCDEKENNKKSGITQNFNDQEKSINESEIVLEKICESHNVEEGKSSRPDSIELTLNWSIMDQIGELPEPRWRHSAVVCSKNGKQMIFVYGGRNEKQLALNNGYFFNPENGQWHKLNSTGVDPGYRQSQSASLWNNQVIIAGGLDLQLRPVNSLHLLDTDSLQWKLLNVDNLLPRYGHTAEVIDNLLVLVGGVSLFHQPPGVAVINLMSGKCSEYSLPTSDPKSLIMLQQHQTGYLGNGKFIVIGGGGNCFSFGTHLNRSPFILDISQCLDNSTQIGTEEECSN